MTSVLISKKKKSVLLRLKSKDGMQQADDET